jgi:RND superfamily putative drug exporter
MVLFRQKGYGSEALFGIPVTGAVTFWVRRWCSRSLSGSPWTTSCLSWPASVRNTTQATPPMTRSSGASGDRPAGDERRADPPPGFAALASGPGTDLEILATALGFGILLDATIVRSLLVPSMVSLFGRWTWHLPDSITRILRIEQSHPHAESPEPSPSRRSRRMQAAEPA